MLPIVMKDKAEKLCDKPCCDITVVATRVIKDSAWETIRSPDPMGQWRAVHMQQRHN